MASSTQSIVGQVGGVQYRVERIPAISGAGVTIAQVQEAERQFGACADNGPVHGIRFIGILQTDGVLAPGVNVLVTVGAVIGHGTGQPVGGTWRCHSCGRCAERPPAWDPCRSDTPTPG